MTNRSKPRIWTTNTYNRLSRYYDTIMKLLFPVGDQGRRIIVKKISAGSVLDVACGTGTLLALAEERDLNCVGLDLSGGMLAEAKRKVPEAAYVQASYYAIPFPEASFDSVVATNALSGTYIDPKTIIQEMLRVCRKDGWVYIAEWPKADRETLGGRILVWFASLNDDAPKDYLGIFRGLGYEPEVERITEQFHIYGIKK